MTPQEIYQAAIAASQKAAQEQEDKFNIGEYHRGFDCGFAWVTIHPARGPFVKYLKSIGVGSRACGGGYQIWYSKLHSISTQSVSVHEAAASAFAKVLKDNGLEAYAGSRLD